MGTMTRDELADRLAVLKREDWPRFRLAHILTDDAGGEAGRRLLSAAENLEHAALIDAYLRHFVPGACPGCGRNGWNFVWGMTHGSGSCACGWPGTLYHYIRDTREIDDLVCIATVNGHPVCDRPRGEHQLVEVRSYVVATGEPRIREELRCPDMKPVPGLSRESSMFPSEYHPPMVAEFLTLLWVHPYEVHLRPKKAEDDGDE